MGLEIIADSIATYQDGFIRHNTKKLSEIIYKLLLEESKNKY
jgi:hypothetical protein